MDTCPLCGQRQIAMFGKHPTRDMIALRCNCCGEFFIDPIAAPEVRGWPDAQRSMVCASVRAASDSGQRLEITSADLPRLRDAAPRWTSPFDGIDRLLLLLASRRERLRGPFKFNKEVDFPLIIARGEREMNELLTLASELNLIDLHAQHFTLEGLRRLDVLHTVAPDSRQAFVAMWFDSSMDEAWTDGFKRGVEDSKHFRAIRVDSIEHSGRIDDRIISEIRHSGLVVADFTGDRGGVYFEAGFAQGLRIPVIWTCREDFVGKLHFDTRQYNHIVWKTPVDLRPRLTQRILANHVLR